MHNGYAVVYRLYFFYIDGGCPVGVTRGQIHFLLVIAFGNIDVPKVERVGYHKCFGIVVLTVQGQPNKIACGIYIVFRGGGGIASIGIVAAGTKKLQEQKATDE